MFKLINKIVIGLLTGLVNESYHAKCVSLINQKCVAFINLQIHSRVSLLPIFG